MTGTLKRILLVEDDVDIQDVVQTALEDIGGYQVALCSSGAEVLAQAPMFAPDLILLDVMMPEMDGPTTLLALRRLPSLAQTPVIYMTATKRADETLIGDDRWILGVIVKPFHHRELAAQIARMWEGQHQHQPDSSGIDSDKLAAVRQRYLTGLPDRIAIIDNLWDMGTPAALQHLHTEIHRLAGSGATLGLARLSYAARVVECAITDMINTGGGPAAEQAARAHLALESFRHAAQSAHTETLVWLDEPRSDGIDY